MEPQPEPPSDAVDRAELVQIVLAAQASWLMHRCRDAVRTRPGIDATDVYQEIVVRMMTSGTAVDPEHPGLPGFLSRSIRWTAQDLADGRIRQGGVPIAEDEFEAALAEAVDEPAADEAGGLLTDREFLARVVTLTDHQIDAVLKDEYRPGLTLKEYADQLGRSYPAMRKDRQRGLDKLEAWLGLDADETAAYGIYRRTGSIRRTAEQIDLPVVKCHALLTSAQLKISNRLHPREEG